MSFSLATESDRFLSSGKAWRAEVFWPRIYVAVDPDDEDSLPRAVDELIAPNRQRLWTSEFLCQDSDGWDLYVLRMEGE